MTGTVLRVMHAAGAPKAVAPEAPGTPTKRVAGRVVKEDHHLDRTEPGKRDVAGRAGDVLLWVAVIVSALGVLVGLLLQLINRSN